MAKLKPGWTWPVVLGFDMQAEIERNDGADLRHAQMLAALGQILDLEGGKYDPDTLVGTKSWPYFLDVIDTKPRDWAISVLECLLERDGIMPPAPWLFEQMWLLDGHRSRTIEKGHGEMQAHWRQTLSCMVGLLLVQKRWSYWLHALEGPWPPEGRIPQLHFEQAMFRKEETGVWPMLHKVEQRLAELGYSGEADRILIAWLLYGFKHDGAGFEYPDRVAQTLRETFDILLYLSHPGDYLGAMAQSHNRGRGAGYFPTPQNVVRLMVKMTMSGLAGDGGELKTTTVLDPCVGTGRFLLEASNYSLNLTGIDIQPWCIEACLCHAYCWVPWLQCPHPSSNQKEKEE